MFEELLDMVPKLEERLVAGSTEEVAHIGDMVRYYLLIKVRG